MFADLYFCDEPYNVCPRGILKRQVARSRSAGYRVLAAIEPEFIVMRLDEHGRPVKAFDWAPDELSLLLRRQAFGYDAEFSLDSMGFLDEAARALDELGWGLSNLVAEGAYSQFELDFGYADVLTTADRCTFLRVLLEEIAKRSGMFVTFMAKPTQGDWRSGAHINHSVEAVDRPGENLFRDEGEEWSATARHVVGGVLRHAPALTAVTCSTVNSYKGMIARARGFEGSTITWAPTHASYGANNRSTMLRLPQARWAIENRAADMCMNGYLALAMTVAAAIEAFDQDPLARETLGPAMHDSYSRYKHDEWVRFHEHISEWEAAEYLRFY